MLELVIVVVELKVLPDHCSVEKVVPVFVRLAVPLKVTSLIDNEKALKVTFPLKVVPDCNERSAVAKVNDCAVKPIWVKPFSLNQPAENPLPPMVMVLVSAKVEVPLFCPNFTPPEPAVLETMILPLNCVPAAV